MESFFGNTVDFIFAINNKDYEGVQAVWYFASPQQRIELLSANNFYIFRTSDTHLHNLARKFIKEIKICKTLLDSSPNIIMTFAVLSGDVGGFFKSLKPAWNDFSVEKKIAIISANNFQLFKSQEPAIHNLAKKFIKEIETCKALLEYSPNIIMKFAFLSGNVRGFFKSLEYAWNDFSIEKKIATISADNFQLFKPQEPAMHNLAKLFANDICNYKELLNFDTYTVLKILSFASKVNELTFVLEHTDENIIREALQKDNYGIINDAKRSGDLCVLYALWEAAIKIKTPTECYNEVDNSSDTYCATECVKTQDTNLVKIDEEQLLLCGNVSGVFFV